MDLLREWEESDPIGAGSSPMIDEDEFRDWYGRWSDTIGLDPDPDHPEHKYDYRGAFTAGAEPAYDEHSGQYHWPSQFKADDHPDRYIGGIDTKTGVNMQAAWEESGPAATQREPAFAPELDRHFRRRSDVIGAQTFDGRVIPNPYASESSADIAARANMAAAGGGTAEAWRGPTAEEKRRAAERQKAQEEANAQAIPYIQKLAYGWVPEFVTDTDSFRDFVSGQALDRSGLLLDKRRQLILQGKDLTKEERAYLDVLQKISAYNSTSEGLPSILPAAAEVVGQMFEAMTSGEKNPLATGVAAGMGAGTTAAYLSGGVTPASAVTVPAAFAAAMGAGMSATVYNRTRAIEAGHAFDEFLELKDKDGKRIDPKTAAVAADIVGNINGALEVVGFEAAIRVIPGLRNLTREGIRPLIRDNAHLRHAIVDAAKRFGTAWTGEVGTEVAQELGPIVTGAILQDKSVAKALASPETKERLSDITEKVGKAMLLLGGVGAGARVATDAAAGRKAKKAAEAAMSEAAKEYAGQISNELAAGTMTQEDVRYIIADLDKKSPLKAELLRAIGEEATLAEAKPGEYVPATEEELAGLTKYIAERVELPEGEGVSVTAAAGTRGMQVVQQVSESLGRRVVFFKAEVAANGFNGVYDAGTDTIYVNESAEDPYLVVLGHESLHRLKEKHSDLYEGLTAAVGEFGAELDGWLKTLNAARKANSLRELTKEDALAQEEYLADFTGQQFGKNEFWAKLNEQNPSLGKRLAQLVYDLVEKIRKTFRGRQIEEAEYFRDINKVQDALAATYAEFARRETQVVDTTAQPVAMSKGTAQKVVETVSAAIEPKAAEAKVVGPKADTSAVPAEDAAATEAVASEKEGKEAEPVAAAAKPVRKPAVETKQQEFDRLWSELSADQEKRLSEVPTDAEMSIEKKIGLVQAEMATKRPPKPVRKQTEEASAEGEKEEVAASVKRGGLLEGLPTRKDSKTGVPVFETTGQAFEFGRAATEEQVKELRELRVAAVKRTEEMIATARASDADNDFNAALRAATESQFLREAIEAVEAAPQTEKADELRASLKDLPVYPGSKTGIPHIRTTGQAYEFGGTATPEQVEELRALSAEQQKGTDAARAKARESKDLKDLDAAVQEAFKGQFLHEAIEAAEGLHSKKRKADADIRASAKSATRKEQLIRERDTDLVDPKEAFSVKKGKKLNQAEIFQEPPDTTPRLQGKRRIRMVTTGSIAAAGNVVRGPEDVASLIAPIRKSAQELAFTVAVAADGTVLEIHRYSKGSKSSASINTIEVMGRALNVAGTSQVYFIHNHPSGSAQPSMEDKAVSGRITLYAALAGIEAKSIIIGGTQWVDYSPGSSMYLSDQPIRPTVRKTKLPVKERYLVEGVGAKDQPAFSRPEDVVEWLEKEHKGFRGIVFMDVKNRAIGLMSLPKDIAGRKYFVEVLRAAENFNAAAGILVLGKEHDTAEVQQYFRDLSASVPELQIHDAIVDGKSMMSVNRLRNFVLRSEGTQPMIQAVNRLAVATRAIRDMEAKFSLRRADIDRAMARGMFTPDDLVVISHLETLSMVDRELNLTRPGSPQGNLININSRLRESPYLLKVVQRLQHESGVPLVNETGEMFAHPMEVMTKTLTVASRFREAGEEAPKFSGLLRTFAQTYLDNMSAEARERFRRAVTGSIESAFEGRVPPGRNELGVPVTSLESKDELAVARPLKTAHKTGWALNLNTQCPMMIIGAHGCYLDGCYVVGMAHTGQNVNFYRSAMYTGEILQLTDSEIRQMNRIGGLRINGMGDTQMEDLPQWRDIMRHASMRGLKLKVITKQDATFEIMERLRKEGIKAAQETVIQPSIDPYWIEVRQFDDLPGSAARVLQVIQTIEKGKPEVAAKTIREVFHRDARVINGKVYRKYGFSWDQVRALAKKYPKLRVLPRVVVSTPKEIAEHALKTPEVLQTWMHAKLRPGMWSEVEGTPLADVALNFTSQIAIRKVDGEWRVLRQKQKASLEAGPSTPYSKVEEYIKANYSKADQERIFKTLAGQLRKDPSSLCCAISASTDACMTCQSACAHGTHYTGTELAKIASRGAKEVARAIRKIGRRGRYSVKAEPDSRAEAGPELSVKRLSPVARVYLDALRAAIPDQFVTSDKDIDADPYAGLDDEIKKRMAAAKGVPIPTMLQKFKVAGKDLWQQLTRHRPFLDSAEYPEIADILRTHQDTPENSVRRAMQVLQVIVGGMKPRQYEVFSISLIMEDMIRDIDSGLLAGKEELPFGFTEEKAREYRDYIVTLAKADPVVSSAIRRRNLFQTRLKKALVAADLLPKEILMDSRYWHHQVLEYQALKAMGEAYAGIGLSSQDVRMKKKGWQMGRVGSIKDYNTQYVEAEFEWISQALSQLETRNVMDQIKERADITQNLKARAKHQNYVLVVGGEENFNRLIELRAEAAEIKQQDTLDSDDRKRLKAISERIAELDPTMPYRQKIAVAMIGLAKMALKGDLKAPAEFDDVVDHLSEWAGAKEDSEGADGGPLLEASRLFAFLNYVMKSNLPGAPWAGSIFKTIRERNQFIKDTLGDKFVTVARLIPEGYTEWKPAPGKTWYRAWSITDRLVAQVQAGEAVIGRETADKIHQILARGRDITWVIPTGLAKTLDGYDKQYDDHVLSKASAKLMAMWKQWTLISPARVIKYNLNNMSGDIDIVFAYDPQIITGYLPRAVAELWKEFRGKEISKELRAELDLAYRLGVLGSGWAVQEVSDVASQLAFQKHMEALSGDDPNVIQRGWRNLKGFTQYRENLLRFAAFRYFRDQIEQDKQVYGASVVEEIDGIEDPDRKAAKLARELLGDYGNITHAGQWLRRHMIPFYAWMEVNAPRYVRMMRNVKHEGKGAEGAARGAAVLAWKGTKLGAKIAGMFILVSLWNRIFFSDEEDELGEQQRRQMHLILGRRSDRSIITLRIQGAFSDALSWFGGEDIAHDVTDLVKGKKSISGIAKDAALATPIKVIGGLRPDVKGAGELIGGRSWYPDPFNARPIRDKLEYIARTFSLGAVYSWVAGKPKRGDWVGGQLVNDLLALFTYTSDPGEMAYYDTIKRAYDWLDERGQERPSAMPTGKGNALYYYKQALRYGDLGAAERYLRDYYELGGTAKSMEQSIKRSHPLGAIAKKNQDAFLAHMSPEERQRLQVAIKWYEQAYKGPSAAKAGAKALRLVGPANRNDVEKIDPGGLRIRNEITLTK